MHIMTMLRELTESGWKVELSAHKGLCVLVLTGDDARFTYKGRDLEALVKSAWAGSSNCVISAR